MPNWRDSRSYMGSKSTFPILAAIALTAIALGGCASEEAASRFLVQPDRYMLYNCEALATTAQANAVRQARARRADGKGRGRYRRAARQQHDLSAGIPSAARPDGAASQDGRRKKLQSFGGQCAIRRSRQALTGGRPELFSGRELIGGTRHSSGHRRGQAWAF